tara:strand:+ start:283 stop:525 length:243 start_codon:yes stop_codon:yes gene_type:complete
LDRIGGRTGHAAIFPLGIEAAHDSIQKEKTLRMPRRDLLMPLNELFNGFRPAVFGWAHALWLSHLVNLQQHGLFFFLQVL